MCSFDECFGVVLRLLAGSALVVSSILLSFGHHRCIIFVNETTKTDK